MTYSLELNQASGSLFGIMSKSHQRIRIRPLKVIKSILVVCGFLLSDQNVYGNDTKKAQKQSFLR